MSFFDFFERVISNTALYYEDILLIRLFPRCFQICATIVGYSYQDVYLTVWTGLAGAAVTALAVVPPWPMYNKNPEKWFDPTTSKPAGAGVVVDGVKVS